MWTNNLRIYVNVLLSAKTKRFGTLGLYLLYFHYKSFTIYDLIGGPEKFGNIVLAKHFAECSMLPHVQSCDCVIKWIRIRKVYVGSIQTVGWCSS